jgi:hypothetical protein
MVKDHGNFPARFDQRVALQAHHLAADLGLVFAHDLAEGVALNGDDLARHHLAAQFDLQLQVAAMDGVHYVQRVAKESACLLRCATHRAGDHPVQLEHVHRTFDEHRDDAPVKGPRVTDLSGQRRDARCVQRVFQRASIAWVVPDLLDRKQFIHRADLRLLQVGEVGTRETEARCAGVVVQRVIGIRLEQAVE